MLPCWVGLAADIGSVVEFEQIPGDRHGYYELDSRRIAVDDGMPVNAQVKTLIHELAHALLRVEPSGDDAELTRAVEEVVVESVAYTVCGALGLDSAGYSIPYLASWSEGELDTLESLAALVDHLARRIEDRVTEAAAGDGHS